MFEKIKSITIKGGFFEVETTLNVFKSDEPISILYGRNGSGKTTIARCVKQLAESDDERSARKSKVEAGEETDYTVSSDITIPGDNMNNIFVFDEDFLRDNVRVEKEGLNTIVMLGDQVELDEKIRQKTAELEVISTKCRELKELRDKFDNSADTSSPMFFFNRIKEEMRKENGWAEIDRRVKGNQILSRITDDVVNRLSEIEEPKEAADEIRIRLKDHLELYEESDNVKEIFWDPIPIESPEDFCVVSGLLTQVLERPELSEREKRLMGFLQEHSRHYSQNVTKEMTTEKWPFCPMCLRENDEESIASIEDTMRHILNDEAERFSEKLDLMIDLCRPIDESLPGFPGELNKNELNDAKIALNNLNSDLTKAREKLEGRKRNIYVTVDDAFTANDVNLYNHHLKQYKEAIIRLKECVRVFNQHVTNRKKLLNIIKSENDLLTRKQHSSLLKGYKLAQESSRQNHKDFDGKTEERLRIEKEIKELKSKKERTDIALGYINQQLQYVFYSDRKVKLVHGDGCYKLEVNGRTVKPRKISIGERNVLGLCYFFAMMFSGKRDDERYSAESLIVIDDPVSSFDYGNRLGVMSLLRYQFNAIIKGNANSRILVMSHDLPSIFDLVKIRKDLNVGINRNKFLELEHRSVKEQSVRNEYMKLMMHVYNYAVNQGSDDSVDSNDMSIGNVMRRLLEAFSSFCYNSSFEKMMCSQDVLNKIDSQKRSYYENFMCRLMLNGESHEEEHAYSLNTMTQYYTKEEKVQTAKSLLLFLMYVNEEHVKAYFDKELDKFNTIKSWQAEEAGWLI